MEPSHCYCFQLLSCRVELGRKGQGKMRVTQRKPLCWCGKLFPASLEQCWFPQGVRDSWWTFFTLCSKSFEVLTAIVREADLTWSHCLLQPHGHSVRGLHTNSVNSEDTKCLGAGERSRLREWMEQRSLWKGLGCSPHLCRALELSINTKPYWMGWGCLDRMTSTSPLVLIGL
jgi:hypothetical protein